MNAKQFCSTFTINTTSVLKSKRRFKYTLSDPEFFDGLVTDCVMLGNNTTSVGDRWGHIGRSYCYRLRSLQLALAVVRGAKSRLPHILIKNTLGRILCGEIIQLYSIVLSMCLELFINLTSELLRKKRITNGDWHLLRNYITQWESLMSLTVAVYFSPTVRREC